MKREQAIDLLRFAGYHGDRTSFTRLYIENRVSYAAAKQAYSQGEAAKSRGLGCGCNDCKKGTPQ